MKTLQKTLLLACLLVVTTLVHSRVNAQTLVPFPPLKGPYKVGIADYLMTDTARQERFTDEADDQRRVAVTVYYPAQVPEDAELSSYFTPALTKVLTLSQQVLDQASVVFRDVPAADGRYPVLLFSPAFGAITHYYSSLLSQLASEGYVVAALWHPYSTSVVVLPDGTELRQNGAGTVTGETMEEQMASLEDIGQVWVSDLRFVLSELQQWNMDHPLLAGRLDLDRVGAMGHSFGGAASVEAAWLDERIDAAINMDGTMFGNAARTGSRVPFLSLTAATPPPTDQQLADIGITREDFDREEKILNDAYELTMSSSVNAARHELPGARHNTFMMDTLFFTPIMRPENKLRSIGEIDPMLAYQQILTWISDFMALHVKDR